MNEVAATPPAELNRPQRVGFAFAKRHGVLVRQVHEGIADCVYRDGAAPLAMAEVRRYMGIPIRLEKVPEETFDTLLRQAYEAGNDAMEAAEGLTGKKFQRSYVDQNRKGDHICYISDMTKFRSHYPSWNITKPLAQIYKELVEGEDKAQG